MSEKDKSEKLNVYRREIRLNKNYDALDKSDPLWEKTNNILDFTFLVNSVTSNLVLFKLSGDILQDMIKPPKWFLENPARYDTPDNSVYQLGGNFEVGPHLKDHARNYVYVKQFPVLKISKIESDYIFEERPNVEFWGDGYIRRISLDGIQESARNGFFYPDYSAVYQTQLLPFAKSLEKQIELLFHVNGYYDYFNMSNYDFENNNIFTKKN